MNLLLNISIALALEEGPNMWAGFNAACCNLVNEVSKQFHSSAYSLQQEHFIDHNMQDKSSKNNAHWKDKPQCVPSQLKTAN